MVKSQPREEPERNEPAAEPDDAAAEPLEPSRVPISYEEQLIEMACGAAQKAYSPYSGVKVGAAVQTAEGDLYTGCNVENASYGLTTCAERNAVAKMVEGGGRLIRRIAVATDKMDGIYPCGACLQVIAEFGGADTEVIVIDDTHTAVTVPLRSLLPKEFRL